MALTMTVSISHQTGRFLMTVGVGLFVAYVVLLIGFNIVGMTQRLLRGFFSRPKDERNPSGGHTGIELAPAETDELAVTSWEKEPS